MPAVRLGTKSSVCSQQARGIVLPMACIGADDGVKLGDGSVVDLSFDKPRKPDAVPKSCLRLLLCSAHFFVVSSWCCWPHSLTVGDEDGEMDGR